MKYKIGDIVEPIGGVGFRDPGPWVILKRQSQITGPDINAMIENGNDLAAVYFGRYLSTGKKTLPGSFEGNIERVTKPSKKELEAARLITLLYSEEIQE